MRKREIKPGFWKNEDLAQCQPHARLLFQGLWGLADREGRLEDRPLRIHAEVFPYEHELQIDKLLCELADRGFIVRYIIEGRKYIQVLTFHEHQNPHPNELPSVIPEPKRKPLRSVTSYQGKKSRTPKVDATQAEISGPSGPSGPSCLHVAAEVNSTATSPPDPPPAVVSFPCVGQGPPRWGLTLEAIAELAESYPGVSVEAEARKALAWIKANPTRRKTATGMPRFLVNWLNRSQNGARASPDQNGKQAGSVFRSAGGDDSRREAIAKKGKDFSMDQES